MEKGIFEKKGEALFQLSGIDFIIKKILSPGHGRSFFLKGK
jgi:hypothetical protein